MLKTVTQTLNIPIRNECDILVVGGGPAGMGAAITAARKGAKVTLIEQNGKLGGMWTLGLVSPFFDNHHKGLNEEFREALKARNAWGGLWNIAFDPAQMALIMNRYALENKIDVLLHTSACEPYMEDNAICGVFVHNKSGHQLILAKTVIDCTGDGDIAAGAGCEYKFGRDGDNLYQPMTMMFKIGGVRKEYPTDRILDWYTLLESRVKDKEKFLEDVPFSYPAIIKLPREGEALIQWTHIRNCRGTDAEELTAATMNGMVQIEKAMEYFKLIKDFLGDVYLLELPAVLGVRETRRIIGEYYITEDDVQNGKKQPDGICEVRQCADIHEPNKKNQTNIHHEPFDVPFRSLVPLGVENLLTAGRCISGCFMAHAAYRVTGNCLKMGEAAGERACAAVEQRCSVRELAQKQFFSV